MGKENIKSGVKNEVKGAGKEVEGKLRNAAGAITGDESEQLKGKGQEIIGKVRKEVGRAQQDADT
jgi:uncharacterized protein YjbJ (UPF0337 family)